MVPRLASQSPHHTKTACAGDPDRGTRTWATREHDRVYLLSADDDFCRYKVVETVVSPNNHNMVIRNSPG